MTTNTQATRTATQGDARPHFRPSVASRRRFRIVDPSNRLPEIPSLASFAGTGTLYIPEHSVPLHPAGIERLLKSGDREPVCLVPQLPVSSELGLAAWDPLAYWTPDAAPTVTILRGLLTRAVRRIRGRRADLPYIPTSGRITETSKEEQVHYFADNFHHLVPAPRQLSVVVGNTCNLKCIMCPYHSPTIKQTHTTGYFDRPDQMSWELMERIAHECGEMKVPVKCGNIEEPLMHPRMIEFVRLCRSLGVPSFHITTNGLPLDRARIRELLEAGLTSVYISVDAARPDTYQRVRGANLAKVERNIREFVAVRNEMKSSCAVRTSFVKNHGVSLEEVDEFRDRWCAEADGTIVYNLGEYKEGNSRFVEVHDFVEQKMKSAGGRWACLNPFVEMYVMPDGRIYYCCETIGKLAFDHLPSMGDYPRQTLGEIWRGPMFQQLRRDLILNRLENWSACDGCGIWMSHACQTEDRPDRTITKNMITEIQVMKR